MKFLLDQDVYAATGRFLIGLGHDVVTVAKIGLSRSSDSDLLDIAHDQSRIFIQVLQPWPIMLSIFGKRQDKSVLTAFS